MDRQNMEGDTCMGGGVTLRSLLQSRDLLSLPAPVKVADKEDIDSCDVQTDATAAFLGPNIWEKTLSDFKLEYFDIDDILDKIVPNDAGPKVVEGDETIKPEAAPQLLQLTSAKESKNIHVTVVPDRIRTQLPLPHPQQKLACKSPPPSPSPEEQPSPHQHEGKKMKYSIELPFSPTELALATAPGHEHFDPTKTVLPDEDLKPQPMVKKSQKNFVPEDLKDDKYWARRRKNNIAAKRSREARRVKENQIVLRASFLEKENSTLKEDVLHLKAENEMLRSQLKKYKQ